MSYSALGYWGSDEGFYNWPDLPGPVYQKFGQNNWTDDEIYVFRFEARNMPKTITSTSQAYPFIRAYIDTQKEGNLNQDIRGIALKPSGAGVYVVEIIITHAGGIHNGTLSTKDILDGMRSSLSEQSSSASIDKGNFAYIEKDKKILQHWWSQPALWSYLAWKNAGEGNRNKGYTQAYQDGKGVWLNSSAKTWQYELKPPPPVVLDDAPPAPEAKSPPSSQDTQTRSAPGPSASSGAAPMNMGTLLLLGLAAAGAYYFYPGKKRKS